MKLFELEAKFLRITDTRTFHEVDEGPAGADGVLFLCPKCFAANGRVGTHIVICWFAHVGQDHSPAPGRWHASGTGYDDLTLTGSVLLKGGCGWHGFVTNGDAT